MIKNYSVWDYLYVFFISRDVAHCETYDRAIKLPMSDVTYSQRVRGDILLNDDLIKQCLISAINLGVITVEIKCTRWTCGFIAIVQ